MGRDERGRRRPRPGNLNDLETSVKVLILGVNGFIGNALTRRILTTTDWEVFGMDLSNSKLEHSLDNLRFHFLEGDITINKEWIEYHVKKSDVVLPLVAIATPATYVKDPLRVFELDFEENLRVVRQCVRYHRRVVFPSTSEVYGMCSDPEFKEDESPLVLGPIAKPRWIYSCSKQLLDRVIAAYGQQQGLQYTLFRPFNWIGPKLDDIDAAKEGSSRVVTQFIIDLFRGQPIHLVDGGGQRRCFTYVEDGISALMRIIENPGGVCDSQIFNIGNPDNECSVEELTAHLVRLYEARKADIPDYKPPRVETVSADAYYGRGYQDILTRKPAIDKARSLLGWSPKASLEEALSRTFDAFLEDWLHAAAESDTSGA
jgi:nucleoside-diphosphate-sugar epimerase